MSRMAGAVLVAALMGLISLAITALAISGLALLTSLYAVHVARDARLAREAVLEHQSQVVHEVKEAAEEVEQIFTKDP